MINGETIKKICTGISHNAMLKEDGTMYTFGAGDSGQLGNGNNGDRDTPQLISGHTDIVDIACGGNHVVFVKNTGSVRTFGSDSQKQLGK